MPGKKAEEMIPVVGRPRMERFPPTASYTPGERKTAESRGKRKTEKDKLPLMVCFYIFIIVARNSPKMPSASMVAQEVTTQRCIFCKP